MSSSSHKYTTLPNGWGCSCPENRIIESKEECLDAAKDLLASGEFRSAAAAVGQVEDLRLSENRWKYSPCGCFFWKGGRKVYYTGDRDDLHCVAVQWAELICKKEEGDSAVIVSDLIDIAPYEWTAFPEDSPRKCLDWFSISRLVHLKKDRNLCIGYDTLEKLPARAVLKRCDNVEGLATLFYTFDKRIFFTSNNLGLCLKVSGTETGTPIVIDTCDTVIEIQQQFDFDSNGRFQSLFNDGYIGVEGCNAVENSPLVIKNLSSQDDCDLTEWLPYTNFNDEIPMTRLWTGVISIYGTLIVLIICIVILGIDQSKKQQRQRFQIRRPGIIQQTAPMIRSDVSRSQTQ